MKTPSIRKFTAVTALIFGGLGALAGSASAAPNTQSAGRPAERTAQMASRFSALTADQKACLSNAGLSRPASKPTVEQRQTLIAAAKSCGIAIPDGVGSGRPLNAGRPGATARFAGLTDAQRSCLTNSGLSRPTSKPTAEQRQKLVEAAKSCGIAVPDGVGSGRPVNAGRPSSVK